MRLTLNHSTANGGLMMTGDIVREVQSGIDNPSDAIVPFGTTLYRTSHARRFNRRTGDYDINGPDSGYESGWWSTSDDFLRSTWFSSSASMKLAARSAFAIHPAWRSDCANYTVIVPHIDLSVWYGIGKTIDDIDPATGKRLVLPASDEILQVFIPGLKENHQKWVWHGGTQPFES